MNGDWDGTVARETYVQALDCPTHDARRCDGDVSTIPASNLFWTRIPEDYLFAVKDK